MTLRFFAGFMLNYGFWEMASKDTAVTWENAVTIPAAQSLITGLLSGLASGAGATIANLPHPAYVGLGTFAIVTLGSWLAYRRDWSERLNVIAGVKQELQAARMEASTIRLEIISDNGHSGDYLALPGGREKLVKLAKGISSGMPFTVRTWTGKNGIYSPGEFDQLRAELIRRGLASWKSPHDNRGGAVLTCAGKSVIKRLSGLEVTPPLAKGAYLSPDRNNQVSIHAHTDTHEG
jgi:hypothetical protein